MTDAPPHPAFAVAAVVFGARTVQVCEDHAEAAALFDRLRRLDPGRPIELIVNGRVTELARRLPAPENSR